MTVGVVGFGTLLKIGNGVSPETYATIAEVKDITGPNRTMEFAEFTHQQSTGGFREYKPTFRASGDITFKCNLSGSDSTQGYVTTGLIRDYNSKVLRDFVLDFPDNNLTRFMFSAYVSGLNFSAPLAGPLEMSVTLHIIGMVTETTHT